MFVSIIINTLMLIIYISFIALVYTCLYVFSLQLLGLLSMLLDRNDPQNKRSSNIILSTDSYKWTHIRMYYGGTPSFMFSYMAARKGGKFNNTILFGLKSILLNLQNKVVTKEDVDEAERICTTHLDRPFPRKMWDHIVNIHDGRLPVEIKAVPEGTSVPLGAPLLTIINTDPECALLVNHLESYLLHIWYTSTVATLAHEIKKVLNQFINISSDNETVDFMLHDFGYRGASSNESAAEGSSAHLTSFKGTDTLLGLKKVVQVYGGDTPAFSVDASEHSTMTSGEEKHQFDVIRDIILKSPKGILSLVLDAYDLFATLEYMGTHFKGIILERDGKLVIRPDSGYPPEVLIRVYEILGKHFGYTTNSKGYKSLNPKVGVIYGDGINYEMIIKMCKTQLAHGWAVENVFGMGGALLQKVDRDMQNFAFKCSAIVRNGEDTWTEIYKKPKTDNSKSSLKGLLVLQKDPTLGYVSKQVSAEEYRSVDNELVTVFKDGTVNMHDTFEEIRARVDSNLNSTQIDLTDVPSYHLSNTEIHPKANEWRSLN